jgi:uncharacterized protein
MLTTEGERLKKTAGDENAHGNNYTAPFITKLQTKNNWYIFDVNSGRILRVDRVVWDIIEDVGPLSKDEIFSKHSRNYSRNELQIAYQGILDAQSKGYFLTDRPDEVVVDDPQTNEEVARRLDHGRSQLILSVTERCNFRCLYCPYTVDAMHRSHSDRDMSWDVAKRAIDEFVQHSREIPKDKMKPTIGFYGGEPLLNFPLIQQCVNYVRLKYRDYDCSFRLTTNGYLLKGGIAEFIAVNNIGITFSLDGPEHIHDLNRRTAAGEGTWKTVTDNLESFLAKYQKYLHSKLSLNIVVTPGISLFELEKYFVDLCRRVPFGGHRASLMSWPVNGRYAGPHADKELPVDINEYYKAFLNNLIEGRFRFNQECSENYILQGLLFQMPFYNIHKRRVHHGKDCRFSGRFTLDSSMCVAGIRKYFVAVDGKYYPCEKIPNQDNYVIGDVHGGLDKDRSFALFNEFHYSTAEQCRNCWCLRICEVGCVSSSSDKTGSFSSEIKNAACQRTRNIMLNRFNDYCAVMEKNPNGFDYLKNITVV